MLSSAKNAGPVAVRNGIAEFCCHCGPIKVSSNTGKTG
jgi:hypothetical protein